MAPHLTASNIGTTLSALLSLLLIRVGVLALLDPVSASQHHGLPITPDNWQWVATYGARQITVGISYLVLLWQDERRAAGLLAYAGVVTVLLDAYVVSTATGSWSGQGAAHLVFAPVAVVMGWCLRS